MAGNHGYRPQKSNLSYAFRDEFITNASFYEFLNRALISSDFIKTTLQRYNADQTIDEFIITNLSRLWYMIQAFEKEVIAKSQSAISKHTNQCGYSIVDVSLFKLKSVSTRYFAANNPLSHIFPLRDALRDLKVEVIPHDNNKFEFYLPNTLDVNKKEKAQTRLINYLNGYLKSQKYYTIPN